MKNKTLVLEVKMQYQRISMFFKILIISIGITWTGQQLNAQEMSQPDGISYTVLSVTEIMKPCPGLCGYNDLGVPIMGIYRRELREYSEYQKGKLIRKWQKKVDVFVKCLKT